MNRAQESLYDESRVRSSVSTRNACKLCPPLGASIAFRGIENCIPLIHGSQGCSTYIRRYVISHFREPVDIASSNFSESSVIFGGGENLKKALNNLVRQYGPEVIGIATTCLSETMGEDVRLYIDEYRRAMGPAQGPAIVHVSTPGYRGTHMEGYHEAVRAVVEALVQKAPPTEPSTSSPVFSRLRTSGTSRRCRPISGWSPPCSPIIPIPSTGSPGTVIRDCRRVGPPWKP